MEQYNRCEISLGKTVLSCTGLKRWLGWHPQRCQTEELVGLRQRQRQSLGAWTLLAVTKRTFSDIHCPSSLGLVSCNCRPAMLQGGLWLVAAALQRAMDTPDNRTPALLSTSRVGGNEKKAKVPLGLLVQYSD
jgi:hypothetical protein